MDVARVRTPSDEKLCNDEKRPDDTSNVEAGSRGIQVETQDVFDEDESGVDPVYLAKARVLNEAFQEIGMGKYQVSADRNSHPTPGCNVLSKWYLFIVAGFGWFS